MSGGWTNTQDSRNPEKRSLRVERSDDEFIKERNGNKKINNHIIYIICFISNRNCEFRASKHVDS